MKRLDRCFLTGCDSNTEWMLPWFLDNYRKTNLTPIVFCDFGVSEKMLKWCERNFDDIVYYETFERYTHEIYGPRWLLKPLAMIETDAHKKVWIDTDCEVLGNISGIFDCLIEHKLSMVQDHPWSKRRGSTWHNSGVVGMIGNPKILFDWQMECRVKSKEITGDQEVLHGMMEDNPMKRWTYINDLPNKYNWLRIQLIDGEDSPDKLVMHWTGAKGKDIIRGKIRNG